MRGGEKLIVSFFTGITSPQEVTEQLRGRLIDCMIRAGEAGPIIELAPPRLFHQRAMLAKSLWQAHLDAEE